jgi:glycosyltransferase involved in cell wall biosynthesis
MAVRGITVISPLFPPARGGLADHTERLAQGLSAVCPVTVLTTARAGAEGAGFAAHPFVRDWHDPAAIAAAVEAGPTPGDVIWQYVPHMYGRGGVNRAVPATMARLKARGCRQVVIAHEIASRFCWWPHRAFYVAAQHWQWRQVLRYADYVGISTEAWLEVWKRRAPQHAGKFGLFPSPSSIPWAALPPGFAARWRAEQALSPDTQLLTYFGTIGVNKQFDWVVRAWQQAQRPDCPVALVVIGDHPACSAPAALKGLYKPLGFLPSANVSHLLQVTDVLALPFVDGVSERRTSFMAGLEHGCAIVARVGFNTGPTLRQAGFFRGVETDRPEQFAAGVGGLLGHPEARAELGLEARVAYARDYAWPRLIEKLSGVLQRIRCPPS